MSIMKPLFQDYFRELLGTEEAEQFFSTIEQKPIGPRSIRVNTLKTSKAAQIGLMRIMARTLGPSGISVSAVAPGLTDTPGARTVNTDEQFDAVVARQALARPLVPEDTAAAVAFLASDGGAAMTGQVLVVDGGAVMR